MMKCVCYYKEINMMKKLIISSMVMLITACGSASLDDHKGSLPLLTLEQFFDGKLKAQGLWHGTGQVGQAITPL